MAGMLTWKSSVRSDKTFLIIGIFGIIFLAYTTSLAQAFSFSDIFSMFGVGAMDEKPMHHTVYLAAPLNNSYTSQTNDSLQFVYNHTGSLAGVVNCTLLLDGTPANYTTSVAANTNTAVYSNSTVAEGAHNWWVNCTNGTDSESSLDIGWNLTFTKYTTNCTDAGSDGIADNIITVSRDASSNCSADGTDDHIEINLALGNATTGNTVRLKNGTYTINNTVWLNKSGLIFEGISKTQIIIKLIDNASNITWPQYQRMINVQNSSITLQNFTIDGNWYGVNQTWFPTGSSYGDLIYLGSSADYATIRNVIFNTTRNDGILSNGADYLTIADNTFYDIDHDAIHGESLGFDHSIVENITITSPTGAGQGANSGLRPTNGVNNSFRNLYVADVATGVLLEQTMTNDASNSTFSNITITGYSTAGINIDSGPKNITNITFRNIILNSTTYAGGGSYPRGVGIKISEVYGNFTNASDNTFSNIVIYKAYEGVLESSSTGNVIKNSIIVNSTTNGIRSLLGNLNLSYNDIWGNGINYNGTSAGTGDISADPLFANVSTYDFHLKSQEGRWNGTSWINDTVTSPAIDAGDPTSNYSLEPAPNGGRINMGAYGGTSEASKTYSAQSNDGDANRFWVRTDGNDSCTGQQNVSYADNSTDCAWLTIQKASSNITAGQTAKIQSGIYGEKNILFTNAGNSTDYIVLQGDGLPNINGTDTIFNMTMNYTKIIGLNITSRTTKSWNVNNATIIPVIHLYSVSNITLQSNYIQQIGFGGYSENNPEQGGITPAIYVEKSNNSLILNNTISAQNIMSEGIRIASSTRNNISQNRIDSRHYYSIRIDDGNTETDYNHTIDASNTGYKNNPIIYLFKQNNQILNGNITDSISVAFSNNVTIVNIIMNNSEGIIFANVSNSRISNYTNIRTNVSNEGLNYTMVKSTKVYPLYLYRSEYNNITSMNVSLGGRHNYGINFFLAHNNKVDDYKYESNYIFGSDGHNDGLEIGWSQNSGGQSDNNTISNFNISDNTWSDYPILLLNGADNNIVRDGTVSQTSGTGNALWFDDATNNVLINVSLTSVIQAPDTIWSRHVSKNNSIINSTISKSGGGIAIQSDSTGDGSMFLINTTVNGIINVTANEIIYRQWYLDVYVNDTVGSPIQNANITAWMNNGSIVFSEMSGSNGYITRQILTEYKQNNSGPYYDDYSNYTINTTKSGYQNDTRETNMTSSVLEAATLSLLQAQSNDGDANQFWVRIDGNDTCSGQNNMSYLQNSTSCAWQTINNGTTAITAGQTLIIGAGTYNESPIFGNSGNSINWTTFTTYGGTVTLNGNGTGNGLTISSKSYINISGDFSINNYANGIYMSGELSYINISNVKVLSSVEGIYFRDNASHITINNVTVRNASEHGILSFGYPYTSTIHHNITITNSIIDDTHHNGIDLHTNNWDVLIENNTFTNVTNSAGVFSHNSGGWTSYNKGIIIRNNTFSNNTRGVWLLSTNDTILENNIFLDSYSTYALFLDQEDGFKGVHNATIRNNSFRNSASYDVLIYPAEAATDTISNVIFSGNNFTKKLYFTGNTTNITDIHVRDNVNTVTTLQFTGSVLNSTIEFSDGRVFAHDTQNAPAWHGNVSNLSIAGITGTYTITAYNLTARPSSGYATIATDGVNLTSIQTDLTSMSSPKIWNMTIFSNDSSTTATFNISTGLNSQNFRVYRNGTLYTTVTTNSTGWLNYKYSGGFSTYEFSFQEASAVSVTLRSPQNAAITNNASITFNCSASSGSNLVNITLYTNQSGWSAKNTTNITGTSNSSEWVNALSDGTYKWNCLAYDNADNSSFAASNYTLAVDTIKPIVQISLPQNTTYDSVARTLNYTATDGGSGINTAWYNYNGTNTTLSGNVSFTALANQQSALVLYANDSAGNVNSTSVSFTVDTIAPVVSLISPANAYNTSSSSINFSFNVTDNINASMACSLYVNGTSVATNASTLNATATTFATGVSASLSQNWTVSCSDGVNSNIPSNRTFNVDNIMPASDSPADALYSLGASAAIGWNLSDNYAGGYYKAYRNGTLQNLSTWTNNTNLNVWVNTSALGIWNYTITYNDSLGNNGIQDSVIINITGDLTTPAYSLNSTNSTVAGKSVMHSLYWTDNVQLSGYIFSFDSGNGTFYNDSWVALSGAGSWSNVTKTVNSTAGANISWQVFANDTSNNWNASSAYAYATTACSENWTYSDWSACSDSAQARTATDANSCGTTVNRSALSQSCSSGAAGSSGGGGGGGTPAAAKNTTNITVANATVIAPAIVNSTNTTAAPSAQQEPEIKIKAHEKINEVKQKLSAGDTKAREKLSEAESVYSAGDYEGAYALAIEAEGLIGPLAPQESRANYTAYAATAAALFIGALAAKKLPKRNTGQRIISQNIRDVRETTGRETVLQEPEWKPVAPEEQKMRIPESSGNGLQELIDEKQPELSMPEQNAGGAQYSQDGDFDDIQRRLEEIRRKLNE